MKCIDELNKRVKNIDIFDVSLTKLSVLFSTLFLVKIWPELASLDWYIYIIIALILAVRPMYHILKK